MALFNFLKSGNKPTPPAMTPRDTLFGDLPLDYWAGTDSHEIPWSLFKEAKQSIDKGEKDAAIRTLNGVLAVPGLESRHYLQAHYFLSMLGNAPQKEIQLYGVVVEVMMPQGLDLLAVYADHTARYYNYSGGSVIWDAPDAGIGSKIDNILLLGKDIVGKIGPWKEPRPAAPGQGIARINFLTSHGLHFGQAPQAALFQDPMAEKIMYAMLDMMQTLTAARK